MNYKEYIESEKQSLKVRAELRKKKRRGDK